MSRNREPASDKLINEAVLYGCAFVVSATGVSAVMMMADNEELTRAFSLALTLGFAFSWLVARRESLRRYAWMWTMGIGAAALLIYRATGNFLGQPVAEIAGLERQIGFAMVLAALVVVRSFGLAQVGDLLFCIVPSLAIFGLAGSQTFEPRFTGAFLIFVFASVYLAGQAHLMTEREISRIPRGEDARRVARERLMVLLVLFTLSAGVAIPAARAAVALVPEPRMSATMQPGTTPPEEPEALPSAGRALWSEPDVLAVGLGPITLSTRLIMRVRADQPVYLRAGSLSNYRGSDWALARTQPQPRRVVEPGPGGFDLSGMVNAPSGRVITQQVTFVEGLPTTTLFAAMQPLQVRPLGAGLPENLVAVDGAGSLSVPYVRRIGRASYEVVSQVDNLRPAGGGSSVLATGDPYLLTIPNSAREIRQIAAEAVGEIRDPEAQVAAITAYLAAYTKYDTAAPATPQGEDAVIYFLTRSRVGYCDLYASAAALMLRALGIPARVAIGYLADEYDPARGVYLVREMDAHAWAEAYLPNTGWTIVDAAPATEQGGDSAQVQQPERLARLLALARSNVLYLLAALAVLAWATMTVKARWVDDYVSLWRRERALRSDDYRGAIIMSYEKLGRAFARRGLGRREWETPGDYARRLGKAVYLAAAMPAVSAITGDYLEARFGGGPVRLEQAQHARQALREVVERLRRVRHVA